MKKAILFFVFPFVFTPLFAQHSVDSAMVAEIDAQVWERFRQSYNTYDAATYNEIHTDDILRVTPWGIRRGTDYKEHIAKIFTRPDLPQRQIDFSFEHRIHEGNTGYEVGFYKVVTTKADGTQQVSIGRFHVVLKKVGGVWKIAQDWDDSEVNGVKWTEEHFNHLKG